MDILTKLSIRRKLFKIHGNIKKNSKKMINKNTHIKVIFLSVIEIDMTKEKNINKQG